MYLTDPLREDGYRDKYITLETWKAGARTLRFTAYRMTNSPGVDAIDGRQGNAEWYGRWVIVAPIAQAVRAPRERRPPRPDPAATPS